MKIFDSKSDRKSHTLDATPKIANQASITDILQASKDFHSIDVTDRKQSTVAGSSSVAQLSQYEVSKTIPLKGYKKPAEDAKDYWIKNKDALNVYYPGATDEEKGDEYKASIEELKKKIQIENVNGTVTYSFKEAVNPLGRAKMEYIPEGATSRNGTMATPVKNLFAKKTLGVAWMGGHLIKDSWGGVDNMMNVAVWDNNKAEKIWSERFEDPLEAHFLIDPTVDSANLNISMVKEDEILPRKDIDLNGFSDLKTQAYLQQRAEKKRWEINDAAETIPLRAHGDFSLEKGSGGARQEIRGVADVNKDDTGYKAVNNVAEQVLMDDVDKVKKSIPYASKPIAGMSEKPGEEQQKVQTAEIEKRSGKRVNAMLEEYDRLHLTPDQFEQDIEPDKISEQILRDITASH